MTIFFYGLCGVLLGLGLVGLGAAAGWLAARALLRRPGRQTRCRKQADEQKAFRQLQNYSAQQAYGLLEGLGGDEE